MYIQTIIILPEVQNLTITIKKNNDSQKNKPVRSNTNFSADLLKFNTEVASKT